MSNDVIQTQFDIVQNFSQCFDDYAQSVNNISTSYNTQSELWLEINKVSQDNLKRLSSFNQTLSETVKKLHDANIVATKDSNTSSNASKALTELENTSASKANKISASIRNSLKKTKTQFAKRQKAIKAIEQTVSAIKNNNEKIKEANNQQKETKKITCESALEFLNISKHFKDLTDALKSSIKEAFSKAMSAIEKIPYIGPFIRVVSFVGSIVLGALSVAWKVYSTSISIFFNMTKTVMSLPFSIAKAAVNVGNTLRTKVIEGIGNQVEAFKEDYDLDSYIGQKLSNLGKLSKEALLALQDNKSRLSQIYGMNNPEQILSMALESTKALGNFAELSGGSINKSIENSMYVIEAQKALGIGSEELKYYALESFTYIEGINKTLHKNITAIDSVSKRTKTDFKILSRTFHKLRTNIVEFGHLSATELAEVSAKIVKMKLSAEDVVGIFSKVSSFEEAANMSAQLFQSFGMTVDAFDMLSANDPVEVINILRDGLLNAGKSFKTLNRHEKTLLKQLTGLSDSVLQTTFSYEGLSLSEEEIREKISEKDPTSMMIEALEGTGSAIKSIVKILNFNSPFSAIWSGLLEAAGRNKDLTDTSQKLQEAYETLQRTIQNVDNSTIESITGPLNIIIRRFTKLITNGTIQKLITTGAKATGDFFSDILSEITDTNADNVLLNFEYSLKKLSSVNNEQVKSLIEEQRKVLNDTIIELNGSLPESIQKMFKERNLLDENGNVRTNITLETSKSLLLDLLNHNDKTIVKTAEAAIESRININDLHKRLSALQTSLNEKEKKLVTEIKNTSGSARVTERLFDGLSKMADKGMPLFKQIFLLGQNLMGGLVRGAITITTAVLNIINGNVEEAEKLLGEQLGDLKGKSLFLNILGFKDNELETLTDSFKKALSETDPNKIASLLTPVFTLVNNTITSSAVKIIEIMKSLGRKVILNYFETMEEGAKKKAYKFVFSKVIENAAAKEFMRTDIKDIDGLSRETLIDAMKSIAFDSSLDKNLVKKYEVMLEKKGMEHQGVAENLAILYQLKTQKEKISKILDTIEDENESKKLKNSFNVYYKTLDNLLERAESPEFSVDNGINGNDLNRFYTKLKYNKSGIFITANKIINAAKPANDIIKVHDSDEVEVIASKPGGLLQSVYKEVSDRFNKTIDAVKVVKNKERLVSVEETSHNEEEKVILDLLDNVIGFIDQVNSKNTGRVVQKNLKIMER
jgi:hypothetical protein